MNGMSRIVRMAVALSERGIPTCTLLAPSADTLSRFDAVVLQRPFNESWAKTLESLRGKVRIIVDIEDHFLDVPAYNRAHFATKETRWVNLIEFILRSADAITVINPLMVDRYRRFNNNIHHVPFGLDIREFPEPRFMQPAGDEVRIVWTGSNARRPDLDILASVIPRIMRDFPSARLYHSNVLPFPVPGAKPLRDDGRTDWFDYLGRLRADIGLNPLNDNDFNRLCFPSKVLEYAALGIPTVASDIESHHGLVLHGITGFLARTEDDWYDALQQLIRSAELRAKMGHAAYEHTRTRYNLELTGPTLEKILRDVEADDASPRRISRVICEDAHWARRVMALWLPGAAVLAWPALSLLRALGVPAATAAAAPVSALINFLILRGTLLRHRDGHAAEAAALGHEASAALSRWNPIIWASRGLPLDVSFSNPPHHVDDDDILIRHRGSCASREAGLGVTGGAMQALAGMTAVSLLLSSPLVRNSAPLQLVLSFVSMALLILDIFLVQQMIAARSTLDEAAQAPAQCSAWTPAALTLRHELLDRRILQEKAEALAPAFWRNTIKSARGFWDYFLAPPLPIRFGGPFNQQELRQKMFETLIASMPIRAIFETGSFRGVTTDYFRKFCLPIRTCELTPWSYGFCKARFLFKPQVHVVNADSRRFLEECADKKLHREELVCFYLDAHGSPNRGLFGLSERDNVDLPLGEELQTIFKNWPNALVLIDDVKVPGDPGYMHMGYGTGKVLDHSYLDRFLGHGIARFIPIPSSRQETGSQAGYVLLSGDTGTSAQLESAMRDFVWRYDSARFAQQIDPRAARNSTAGMPCLLRLKLLLRGLEGKVGSIAEVGVYRGGTALLLAQNAGGRKVQLFDTFRGMPETSPALDEHRAGDFSDTSIDHVGELMQGLDNVSIHAGMFPQETAKAVEGESFALVHLDCSSYKSTQDSLEFFFPRLVPGGVVVINDYNDPKCRGVKAAADGFAKKSGMKVVPTVESQAMLAKT